MSIQLTVPSKRELKPRIVVFGVGGAGGNAVNNMISAGLEGVDFVVANTDAQALSLNKAERRVQMGAKLTEGLGAGSDPEVGRGAAEEALPEIMDILQGSHMVFVTAGMGGGTGTGAAPVIARAARESGILTVGVVTKPFDFEGARRSRSADVGIEELAREVDTLIIIPNQNLFRIANAQTTFGEAFAMADEVLHSGVAGITDLMIRPGLINLDFADVRTVMNEMGKAMMGTGEAEGDNRAIEAAEAAIANPLLDDVSMRGANGVLINITGGHDMTLYEVDAAANRIREEVDSNANIIIGSTFDETIAGQIRVSVVATGIEAETKRENAPSSGIGTIVNLKPVEASPQLAVETASLDQGGSFDLSPAPSGSENIASNAPASPSQGSLDSGLIEAASMHHAPPASPDAAEAASAMAQAPAASAAPAAEASPAKGELPSFLTNKPVAAPKREPSQRSRGFIERVFGNRKRDETAGAPAEPERMDPKMEATGIDTTLSANVAAETSVSAPANVVPSEPAPSEVANTAPSVPSEVAPAPEAAPVVPEVTTAPVTPATPEAQPSLDDDLRLPDLPSRSSGDNARVTASAPQPARVELSSSSSVASNSVASAPQATMQTTMQTPQASSSSYDGDQLDIPTFLRR